MCLVATFFFIVKIPKDGILEKIRIQFLKIT